MLSLYTQSNKQSTQLGGGGGGGGYISMDNCDSVR